VNWRRKDSAVGLRQRNRALYVQGGPPCEVWTIYGVCVCACVHVIVVVPGESGDPGASREHGKWRSCLTTQSGLVRHLQCSGPGGRVVKANRHEVFIPPVRPSFSSVTLTSNRAVSCLFSSLYLFSLPRPAVDPRSLVE
jgi:hypothetical protein